MPRFWIRLGARVMTASVLSAVFATAAFAAPAEATGEARKNAETLFNRYVDLEHAFDPALVGLYSNTAHIESRILVEGRKPIVRTFTGAQYKTLLSRALTQAKQTKTDLNYYSGVSYLREGDKVRIKASRYAALQKAVSPVELLVGPDGSGSWKIFEELSESHPVAGALPPPPRNGAAPGPVQVQPPPH